MKRELMVILACPICRGKLELSVEAENKEEIVSGTLHCRRCNKHYTIVNNIPNLLPPDQSA